MLIQKILFFLICSISWSADNFTKFQVKKIDHVFQDIKSFGHVKYDYCESCLDSNASKLVANSKLKVSNFAAHIKKLPNHETLLKTTGAGLCAKGVRTSLNILFGKNPSYAEAGGPNGRPAKDYDEDILSKWRTPKQCFKNITDDNKSFSDFDIKVIQPKNSALAGHIEIYYKGIWYSDFRQDGTYWDGGRGKTWKSRKLYRLSKC